MVAVPFWGRGGVQSLGLQRGSNVRIICNLDHPGCNPNVFEELCVLEIEVKTHRRLHAKICVTPTIAIVGSSNVSTNGLTVEGAGDEIRKGLVCPLAGAGPSRDRKSEQRDQPVSTADQAKANTVEVAEVSEYQKLQS
jgi:PLD-like domain